MHYVAIAKLLAEGIDIEKGITHFLSLPQTHATGDLLEALIGPNATRVSMESVLRVLLALPPTPATAFYKFMMKTFGPRPEFLPVSLSNVQYAILYCRELSKLKPAELARIRELLGIPEVMDGTPQRALDELSAALASEDAPVDNNAGWVMLKFVIENCLKYNVVEPFIQYLLVCSRAEALRSDIARVDIWSHLFYRIESEEKSVMLLLQRLPLPTFEVAQTFLTKLTEMFIATPERRIAEAIAEVLKQSDDFQIDVLTQLVAQGLNGTEPLLSLIIARGLGPRGFSMVAAPTLWATLSGHLLGREGDVLEAIAKFVERILGFGPSFPFDPEFFATILNVMYAPDTPYSMCKDLILLLARSSMHRPILVFLEKRKFGSYLMQLPWRYPSDSTAVFETLEKTAKILEEYYQA
jgi:hypothetical protein